MIWITLAFLPVIIVAPLVIYLSKKQNSSVWDNGVFTIRELLVWILLSIIPIINWCVFLIIFVVCFIEVLETSSTIKRINEFLNKPI